MKQFFRSGRWPVARRRCDGARRSPRSGVNARVPVLLYGPAGTTSRRNRNGIASRAIEKPRSPEPLRRWPLEGRRPGHRARPNYESATWRVFPSATLVIEAIARAPGLEGWTLYRKDRARHIGPGRDPGRPTTSGAVGRQPCPSRPTRHCGRASFGGVHFFQSAPLTCTWSSWCRGAATDGRRPRFHWKRSSPVRWGKGVLRAKDTPNFIANRGSACSECWATIHEAAQVRTRFFGRWWTI